MYSITETNNGIGSKMFDYTDLMGVDIYSINLFKPHMTYKIIMLFGKYLATLLSLDHHITFYRKESFYLY